MGRTVDFLSPTGNVSGAELVLLDLLVEAVRWDATVRCLCPAGDLVARLPDGVDWIEIPEQALGAGPRPLGAAACLGVMSNLPPDTWLRLAVWLVIGFGVYFLYSQHHSKLAKAPAP